MRHHAVVWEMVVGVVVFSLGGCGSSEKAGGSSAVAASPARSASDAIEVTVTVSVDVAAPITVAMRGAFGLASGRRIGTVQGAVGEYQRFNFRPPITRVTAATAAGVRLAVTADGDGALTVDGDGDLAEVVWQVDAAASEATAGELQVSLHRRADYLFLSGYAAFLRVGGADRRPYIVKYDLPPNWLAATSLPPTADGRFTAADLLELVDEPAMLGSATVVHSQVVDGARGGAVVHVFVEGGGDAATRVRALADATRGAAAAIGALGFPVWSRPYHVFFEYFTAANPDQVGWALEHGMSFHGVESAKDPPAPRLSLLYHTTHHMLHAWVPRRIYNEDLSPWRQLDAQPTRGIWFAEGFAQYLAFKGMARAGLAPEATVNAMMKRRFGPALAAPMSAGRGLRGGLAVHSLATSAGDHSDWARGFSGGAALALTLDHAFALAKQLPLEARMLQLLELCATSAPHAAGDQLFGNMLLSEIDADTVAVFTACVEGTSMPPASAFDRGLAP